MVPLANLWMSSPPPHTCGWMLLRGWPHVGVFEVPWFALLLTQHTDHRPDPESDYCWDYETAKSYTYKYWICTTLDWRCSRLVPHSAVQGPDSTKQRRCTFFPLSFRYLFISFSAINFQLASTPSRRRRVHGVYHHPIHIEKSATSSSIIAGLNLLG